MGIKIWVYLGALVLFGGLLYSIPGQEKRPSPRDDREKASYALGLQIGGRWKNSGYKTLEIGAVRRGLADGMAGRSLLTLDEIGALMAVPDEAKKETAAAPRKWISFFGSFGTEAERQSYAMGANVGIGWNKTGSDLLADIVAQGIQDAWTGAPPLMGASEAAEAATRYGRELMARQVKRQQDLAVLNRRKGEEFLAKNRSENGVRELPCGVQYKVLAEGSGNSPEMENYVLVKYSGMRIDGTVFDSSQKYNKPALAAMGSMIAGWSEALLLMKPGDRWRLFIPANEAFGDEGTQTVQPGETVIYEMELVQVLSSHPQMVGTTAPD